MTIMHQSADDLGGVSQYLEQERRLFEAFEAGAVGHHCVTWESTESVVVVGRNTVVADYVVVEACLADGVPVLRRFSGGGAVVLAPGCLNYAIAISLVSHPSLADVARSLEFILGRTATALGIPDLAMAGEADLALHDRKVSGNAQRRGRRAMLHHGTLLYAFDATLASRYLREPSRQPAYRRRRQHMEFIGNLPFSKRALEDRVLTAWCEVDAILPAHATYA